MSHPTFYGYAGACERAKDNPHQRRPTMTTKTELAQAAEDAYWAATTGQEILTLEAVTMLRAGFAGVKSDAATQDFIADLKDRAPGTERHAAEIRSMRAWLTERDVDWHRDDTHADLVSKLKKLKWGVVIS